MQKSLMKKMVITLAVLSIIGFGNTAYAYDMHSGMNGNWNGSGMNNGMHTGMNGNWNGSGMNNGMHTGMNGNWNGIREYSGVNIDLTDDVFVNPNRFEAITGGLNFPDENGDGIVDYAQDTSYFDWLNVGEFIDDNGDNIHDPFQTQDAYQALGIGNFMDINGDGLCDNYAMGRFMQQSRMYCNYNAFQVNMGNDIFVNPVRFGELTGGMYFPDENGDGLCDYVQDTVYFQNLNVGKFIDENGDGIHDPFQTRSAYNTFGMRNFVDIDGDGLCDNYRWNVTIP